MNKKVITDSLRMEWEEVPILIVDKISFFTMHPHSTVLAQWMVGPTPTCVSLTMDLPDDVLDKFVEDPKKVSQPFLSTSTKMANTQQKWRPKMANKNGEHSTKMATKNGNTQQKWRPLSCFLLNKFVGQINPIVSIILKRGPLPDSFWPGFLGEL